MNNETTNAPATHSPYVLTTGDVVMDIGSYQGDTKIPPDPKKPAPHLEQRLGGAKHLHDMIEAAVGPEQAKFGLDELDPIDDRPHIRVHTLWCSCKGGLKTEHEDAAKGEEPVEVWRVDKPLGCSRLGGEASEPPFKRADTAKGPCQVLVIDDAGLGFRTVRARKRWPQGVSPDETQQPAWIVLKMSNPLAQGDLWRELTRAPEKRQPAHRRNLIVITSADEMRHAGAAITRGLSWERTLTELRAELHHNPTFSPLLTHARHLIVNLGCVGAVWIDNFEDGSPPSDHRVRLIYDPTLAEGQWKSLQPDTHRVYGILNAFTTAIAVELSKPEHANPSQVAESKMVEAIERGLSAVRLLRLLGHGPSNQKPDVSPTLSALASILNPDIAATKAASDYLELVAPHGYREVPNPPTIDFARHPKWTLAGLTENPATPEHLSQTPLYGLAHRVALYGEPALRGIPHARFGKLLSIDRDEMETLRGLHQRIDAYEKGGPKKQPLCLAAFGPPGAGKSFGIKEIAKQTLGDGVPILEFNLSQYDEPSDLIGAFHQVRDMVLQGHTPVVFWDEFDSRDYHWLQYLLAPMQDGTFQQNGHTHTIGKCIFVFAGGTSWDFEHFGPAPMPEGWDACSGKPVQEETPIDQLRKYYAKNKLAKQVDQTANADFKRKKGPDFLSRLDGYINVLGPNRRRFYDWCQRQWSEDEDDPNDLTFPIRRALLLRHFLNVEKPDERLEIDRGLLHAFLLVPRYKHGARSLEKIARPLAAATKKPPFRKAHLPPPQILDQHLEYLAEFNRLYERNRDFITPENLRRIAAAVADFFDWTYNPHGGDRRTREQAIDAFEDADSWSQATNLAAAQRLPDILALASLRLEGDLPSSPPDDMEDDVQKHLEFHLEDLAEEEHNLWMAFHFDNGWQQVDRKTLEALERLSAEERKAEIKRLKIEERRHTLLIPFSDLPAEEKQKDHDAIRNFPYMAKLVGWRIVFENS